MGLDFQQGHVVYARRGMARESLETFLATFLGSSGVALSLRLDPDVSSELGTNTVGENKVQVPVDHGHMWTEPLVHAVEHVPQDTKNKVVEILDRCRRAMGGPTGRQGSHVPVFVRVFGREGSVDFQASPLPVGHADRNHHPGPRREQGSVALAGSPCLVP